MASPTKATFKHDLPANLSPGYFQALENFALNEFPDYLAEHHIVCEEIVNCAHVAAAGFVADAGKVDEKLLRFCTGKPLLSPQRDVYNGPLQSFLQHSTRGFGKRSLWEAWISAKQQLAEELTAVGTNCIRHRWPVVEDHPPLNGGSGSPAKNSHSGGNSSGVLGSNGSGSFINMPLTGGSFSGRSPLRNASFTARTGDGGGGGVLGTVAMNQSFSFGRMIGSSPLRRADASAGAGGGGSPVRSFASTNDVFIRVGLNSYFDPERLVMVHIWANSRAARTFIQRWRRLAQICFEHRLEMFHVPISVVNCIDGTFVSVTPIPPLCDPSLAPPLKNVGATKKGKKGSDGGSSDEDSLAACMVRQLVAALRGDGEEDFRHEGITLHPGVDGRFYIMDLLRGISKMFDQRKYKTCVPREELLSSRILADKADAVSIDEYARTDAISATVDDLFALIGGHQSAVESSAVNTRPITTSNGDPPTSVDELMKGRAVSLAMHKHGLNISMLGEVLEFVNAKNQSDGEPADAKKTYQLIASTIITEMIGRTLKYLVRLDCLYGAAGGKDRGLIKNSNNSKRRLDVINRIARSVMGKDADFLDNHLMPIVRTKFDLHQHIVFSWADAHGGSILRMFTRHLGCEFGGPHGNFFRFVPVASQEIVTISCPPALRNILKDNKKGAAMCVDEAWKLADATSNCAPLHQAFLLRAAAISVMADSSCDRIPTVKGAKRKSDSVDESLLDGSGAVYQLLFFSIVFEHLASTNRDWSALTQFVNDLKQHVADATEHRIAVTRLPFGATIAIPEVTFLSMKLLHAAATADKVRGDHQHHIIDISWPQEAIKIFLDQQQIVLPYSAQHGQALRDVESLIPIVGEETLYSFLTDTVAPVMDAMIRGGRPLNAARYGVRVTSQLINVRLAEGCGASAKLAATTYDLHVKAYGNEDARTALALYLMVMLTLSAAEASNATTMNTVANLRKIIGKAQSLDLIGQSMLYRSSSVFLVLQKAVAALEFVEDTATASRVGLHVGKLSRYHSLVSTIQRCGRGYMVRRRRAASKMEFIKSTQAVPQPPTQLVSASSFMKSDSLMLTSPTLPPKRGAATSPLQDGDLPPAQAEGASAASPTSGGSVLLRKASFVPAANEANTGLMDDLEFADSSDSDMELEG